MTDGGSFFGTLSIGAGASLPWKVRPTATSTIEPFVEDLSFFGSFRTLAEPKRSATFPAAAFERFLAGFQ